jgi:hypothetical protein
MGGRCRADVRGRVDDRVASQSVPLLLIFSTTDLRLGVVSFPRHLNHAGARAESMFTSLTNPQKRAGGIDVSLLTSGHDLADARLHREIAAVLSRGLGVEVLALGQAQDAPAGAKTRT